MNIKRDEDGSITEQYLQRLDEQKIGFDVKGT